MPSPVQIQDPWSGWSVQTCHTRLSQEEGGQACEGAQCGEEQDDNDTDDDCDL